MNQFTTSVWQKAFCLLVCLGVCLNVAQAQVRVGQPASPADPSASMEVSSGPYDNGSAFRGFLPPKVALVQTSLPAPITTTPAQGLLVYNTAQLNDVTPGYYYWEGQRWIRLSTINTKGARQGDSTQQANATFPGSTSAGQMNSTQTDFTPGYGVTLNGGVLKSDTLEMATRDYVYSQLAANSLVPTVVANPVSASQSSSIAIFHYPHTIEPGQPIFIQGAFSSSAVAALAVGDGSNYVTLTKKGAATANAITTEIPSVLRPDQVYQLIVVDGNFKTAAVYPNKAEGWGFSSDQVYGSTVLGVIGANLLPNGANPKVTFVPIDAGATSVTATVNIGNSHDKLLQITVPTTLQAGKRYRVEYNNGLSTPAGSNTPPLVGKAWVDDTLTYMGTAADLFQLGTPWAGNLANMTKVVTVTGLNTDGNNNADKINAQLITTASGSGGLLRIPAGNWPISKTINIPSNAVLAGTIVDGVRATTLTYGAVNAGGADLFTTSGSERMGVMDLSLKFAGQGTSGWNNGQQYGGVFDGTDIFFKNVKWDAGDGLCAVFAFYGPTSGKRIALLQNDWTNGVQWQAGPVTRFDYAKYLLVQGNLFTFRQGPGFDKTSKTIVQGNVFRVDATSRLQVGFDNTKTPPKPVYGTYHLNTVNTAERFCIDNNTYLVINGPLANLSNDYESIISEVTGLDFEWVAKVTATNGSALTGASSFSSAVTSADKVVIRIITGKGVGQTRNVIGKAGNTFTIDRPWDIAPDTSSVFTTNQMASRYFSVVNNSFYDQQRGCIWYYAESYEGYFEKNRFQASGAAIYINGVQLYYADRAHYHFAGASDIRIAHNVTDARTDPDNGTMIGAQAGQGLSRGSLPEGQLDKVRKVLGTQMTNIQILHNTVISREGQKVIIDSDLPSGLFNFLLFSPSVGPFNQNGQIALWGTTLWDNDVTTSTEGIITNLGSNGMQLKNNRFNSVTTPYLRNYFGLTNDVNTVQY